MKELEGIRGRHTELISVYIPAGYNLVDIINQLYTEKSTAMNIKSKQTRKNVVDALEKIIQHLRIFKQTPPNGLIVFCGNVSEIEGKQDLKIWSFEPPEKLNTKIYWCDQVFVLDPLKEMVAEKDVYGLIVLDSKEANIGLLYGKRIMPLKHISSTVPGKAIKGGMCVSEDSLLQLENGNIIPIKELTKDKKILSYCFKKYQPCFVDSFKIFKRKSKEIYKLKFNEPSTWLTLTPEHLVFVVGDKGVEEKNVDELEKGDKLLFVSNISYKTTNKFSKELYQLLGYFVGNGIIDNDRIIFCDKDLQLLNNYKKIVGKLVEKEARILKKGNNYELRIHDKKFVEFIKSTFVKMVEPKRKKDLDEIILISSNEKLRYLLKGLFDAKSYLDSTSIRMRLSNENIIRKLQLILARFGIISSISGPDKFKRFELRIANPIYVKKFKEKIGFSSKNKMEKLNSVIREYKRGFSNRVPLSGIFVRNLIETNGFKKEHPKKYGMFLLGKRNLEYPVFKNLLHELEKKIKNHNTIEFLRKILNSELILVTLKEKKKIIGNHTVYDLYVPKTNSFVVNGIVVHNSQVRYDRIREQAIIEFLHKVGEVASEAFLKQKELKGVIIGGPGYIKNQLAEGEFLNYQIKQKILGVKDTGYTGEEGLEELVQRSEDLLKEAAVMKERQLLQKFFTELQKGGKAIYGYTQTIEALNLGALDTLLVSEDFDWVRVKLKCDNTHETEKDLPESEIERQICEVCGQVLKAEDKDYLGELLSEKAQNFGTTVEIISTDTPEGQQFKHLGGIGGFLRYKIR